MTSLSEILHQGFWPLLILAVVLIGAAVIIGLFSRNSEPELDYERREYLFDAPSEFKLFKLLEEVYGNQYYVFPQVHYSSLLRANRKLSFRDRWVLWNKINRKSADFVLCDKERIQPKLVIELDGSSHDLPQRRERDEFINYIAERSDLRILHLRSADMYKEQFRGKIDQKLS